jgi:hypothetical protein
MDPLKRGTSRPVVLIPSRCPPKTTTAMTKDTPQIYQRDTPNKKPDKPLPAAKFSEPITKGVIEDSEGDDSAEEEIVTAGARATLNNSPPRRVAPRPNVSFETHHLPGDPPSEDESSELESESDQLETPGAEPQEVKPRHVGFPPVEELPIWFPRNIKRIYRVDRHGGALSYKASPPCIREAAGLTNKI